MADLVAVLVIIAVVIGGGAFASAAVLNRRLNRLGHSVPSPSSSASEARAQAKVAYHLAQQAVLILDQLVGDDMTRVVIPSATQEKIRALSKQFYDL